MMIYALRELYQIHSKVFPIALNNLEKGPKSYVTHPPPPTPFPLPTN